MEIERKKMDNDILLIAAPLNLAGTNLTETSNTLNWDAVADATNYTIYRSLNENDGFTQIGTATNNNYVDEGLTPNTTYYYRVTATGADGESTPSNTISLITAPRAIPTTPTNLTATTLNQGGITLNWTAVPDAERYYLYRSLEAGGPFEQVAEVVTPPYTDTGLMPNTTYYYTIAANNESGTSAQSAPVNATTLAVQAPTNLQANPLNANQIRLNWIPKGNVDSYIIYRSLNPEGPYNQIGTSLTTTYLDSNLLANTTYYYRVSSVYRGVTSKQSPIALATTPLDVVVPNAPTDVVATPRDCNSINITWSFVDNAQGYYIYQSRTARGPFTLVGQATGNQYIMNNLLPNTDYYYQVVAYNREGQSLPSTAMMATTNAVCNDCGCYRRVCRIVNRGNNLYRCCYLCYNRCRCCR